MIDLYPAIDLLGGRVVRLRQGDYDDETVYGDDPVAVARAFVAAGARWVHVVDLDAARSGDPVNRPVVAAIAAALAGVARVQTGGGVRTVDDARELADAGVARVVMGSAAVREPALVEAASVVVPVAVGLDHRDGELAVHGWTEGSGVTARRRVRLVPDRRGVRDHRHRARRHAGRPRPRRAHDGRRNSRGRRSSPAAACRPWTTWWHCRRIENLGGIITGKAVYEGRFTVVEALEALAQL